MGTLPETGRKETTQPDITPEAALEDLSPEQRDFLIRLNFFGEGPILRGMLQIVLPNPDRVEDRLEEFSAIGLVDKQGEKGPYMVSELGRGTVSLMLKAA